jgi:DNA gyrase subunit A
MIITDKGTIIRMSVSDINVYSRTAGGVIVMRTGEENRIVTLSRLEKIEDIEKEEEEINKENEKKNSEIQKSEASLPVEDDEETFDEN